jgi:putative ABC transport system permease protein
MSALLIKRLFRSLWRTKLRLFSVVFMIVIGVFSGISFGSYAITANSLYDVIYADTEEGVNLPDLWVETHSGVWDEANASTLCTNIETSWPDTSLQFKFCEPRLKLDGLTFYQTSSGEEKLVPSVWHGIDEGLVDRVWLPDDECCEGRLASADNEIVLDEHAASGMGFEVGDSISIAAGFGKMDYTIVGIGFHSNHLYFAQEGVLMPADAGTFVTGYMDASGLERLSNYSAGSANLLLIDIEGTPEYDLQSTTAIEGVQLSLISEHIASNISQNNNSAIQVYDRSGVDSVEFLRADAEGAIKSYPYVTGMLGLVAGITIFLSLQRLIQSQAKEIAVLRTLGVRRRSIMPGYVIAPLFIGGVGSLFGVILGYFVGAPAMSEMYEDIIGVPIIETFIPTSLILQNIGIVMVIVFISGIRPAWQAAQMQPLDVFRGQSEIRLSSRTIQRLTAWMPATVSLSVRSSLRKPMRLAFTFFAVGISMLIFGSMILMMGSIDEVVIGGLEERQSWDSQIYISPGGEHEVIQWAEGNDVNYELLLQFPANPKDDSRQIISQGIDEFSTTDNGAMQILVLKEGSTPQISSQTTQVMVDEGTAHFLDWGVGDIQTLEFGSNEVDVEIVGITQGEISRTIYFHRADLVEILDFEATSVLLVLPEGVEIPADLAENTLGIMVKEDIINSFETMMKVQKQFYVAVEGLGTILAVAVLFNTLLMNLAERDTELATLRVLGAPMKSIGLMMLGEHIAIGIIGGILAAIFSIVGTKILIGAMVQWAFFFTVQANWPVFVLIAGVVLGISIALTPFGMWRVWKMNLVDSVKDLSN